MPDSDEALERRLAAVERALDGDATVDRSDTTVDPEALEARVTELEARVDELDAAVQAIRGFLGGVSAVNERVERRADAAVAAVDRLERRLDDDTLGEIEPREQMAQSVAADSGGDGDDPRLRDRLRDLQ